MADMNVYMVKYGYRYNREKEWFEDTKNVLANGTAEAAIERARKEVLRDHTSISQIRSTAISRKPVHL